MTVAAGELAIRTAAEADVPAIAALLERSVRGLSTGYYTAEQIERALRDMFGVDTQLIADRSYYVIDAVDGLAAAGGWSGRRTLYGGDQAKGASDPRLDPQREPARIRAFFVDPAWARRGLARRLFERCRAEAEAAGFHELELVATLPGQPLYLALGFTAREHFTLPLSGGLTLDGVRMTRPVEP